MSPVWHSWDSSSSRWSPLEKRDPIPLRPLVNLASPVGAETVLHRMDPGVHGILRALTLQEIKPVPPPCARTSFTFRQTYSYLVPIGPISSALITTGGSLLFRVSLSVRRFFSSNSRFLLPFQVSTPRRLTSDSSSMNVEPFRAQVDAAQVPDSSMSSVKA